MDSIHSAPRHGRASDIAQVDENGVAKRDANGDYVLLDDPPDAPGFPMPIRGSQVDLSMPHATLDFSNWHTPRDRLAQSTDG